MKNKFILLIACVLTFFTSMIYAAQNNPLELNKQIVADFYNLALNQKDFVAASKYLGPWYKQHNPLAADGPEGLKGYIEWLKEKLPKSHSEMKTIFADGDFVIVHVHFTPEPGARGSAIVDIFKLNAGKIVEHWDVIQEIPEKSANPNGMF